MKHVNYAFKDPSVQQSILGSINSIAKDNVNYMQKYKTRLKNLAETASVPPRVRHAAKDIILILEGKRFVNEPGPEVIKILMVDSAEPKILNAHKYKTIKKLSFILNSDGHRLLFFLLINVKMQQLLVL